MNITTEFREGILFVRLKGHLDKNTVPLLNREVTSLVSKLGVLNIVFNVRELQSIDLNGISALFYNYRLVNKSNGVSLLCGVNDKIDKKLRESRILNYIYEISDELNAIKVIKWKI